MLNKLNLLNDFLIKQTHGAPPRPGLVWNPYSHRWVREDSMGLVERTRVKDVMEQSSGRPEVAAAKIHLDRMVDAAAEARVKHEDAKRRLKKLNERIGDRGYHRSGEIQRANKLVSKIRQLDDERIKANKKTDSAANALKELRG